MYDEELAKAILEYLRDQPGSGDTLEGISKWWIMRRRIEESIEMVRSVLEELGGRGLISERSIADGSIVYFAHEADPTPVGKHLVSSAKGTINERRRDS